MLIFASKEEPTDWNTDSDPLKNFFECDSEIRLNIIIHHPQVKGVIFVRNNFLSVAYIFQDQRIFLRQDDRKYQRIPRRMISLNMF